MPFASINREIHEFRCEVDAAERQTGCRVDAFRDIPVDAPGRTNSRLTNTVPPGNCDCPATVCIARYDFREFRQRCGNIESRLDGRSSVDPTKINAIPIPAPYSRSKLSANRFRGEWKRGPRGTLKRDTRNVKHTPTWKHYRGVSSRDAIVLPRSESNFSERARRFFSSDK